MVTVVPSIAIAPARAGRSDDSITMSLSASDPNVFTPGLRKCRPATVNHPLSASRVVTRSARKVARAASSD